MSSRTNSDDFGSAMMDVIHQHGEIKTIADFSDELNRISYSSEDESVQQLCLELNRKLLELSTKLIAHYLEDAGF